MPIIRHRSSDNHRLQAADAKITSDTRIVINESLALLRNASPDTFLGRQTHEPFKASQGDKPFKSNPDRPPALLPDHD